MAAKAASKLAAQLPRQRLPGPRKAGAVVEWRGSFGWVKPDAPVDHVLASKNGGRVYMTATDAQNGLIPRQGVRVDFALYSDASGIGAQQVRPEGGKAPKQQLQQSSQVKGVIKTIQKSKFKGAKAVPGKQGGGDVKALVPQPKFQAAPPKSGGEGAQAELITLAPKAKVAPGPGNKAKIWSGAARAAPAPKAAGAKAPNSGIAATLLAEKAGKKVGKDAPADKTAERTPVQGDRWFSGVVTQFFGRFGWVKPDVKIHHPKASGYKGLLYCHVDSAAPSCTEIVKGMAVRFRVYADANGLGAQDIQDKFGHVRPAAKVAAAPVASSAIAGGKGVGGKPGTGVASKGKGKGPSAKGASPTAVFVPAPKAAAKVLPVQKTILKKGSSPSSATAANKGAGKGAANAKGKASAPLLQAVKLEAGVAAAGAGKSKGKGKAATSAVDASKSAGASKGAAAKGVTAGKPAGKATGKGQQPPMPPNWEEHWSDEHAVPYFWNRMTKESRWIRPTK